MHICHFWQRTHLQYYSTSTTCAPDDEGIPTGQFCTLLFTILSVVAILDVVYFWIISCPRFLQDICILILDHRI